MILFVRDFFSTLPLDWLRATSSFADQPPSPWIWFFLLPQAPRTVLRPFHRTFRSSPWEVFQGEALFVVGSPWRTLCQFKIMVFRLLPFDSPLR